MLMFGTQSLWWSCSIHTHTDWVSGRNNTSNVLTSHNYAISGRISLDNWRSVVRDFTRRFLTFPDDKYPAIAGVAAHCQKSIGGWYLGGFLHI